MIRIIHISDFHLNSHNLKDWNEYVKSAFLETLDQLNKENKITIIACTGDLIDKGGKEYDNISEAFNKFEKQVVIPTINKIGLEKTNFVIVPGNHDVDRDLDGEPIDLGFISYFTKDYSNISSFMLSAINKAKRDGIKRIIPFKEFENKFYLQNINSDLSIFGSAHKIETNGINVGLCCLNSSWRAFNKDDKENLIVGEEQLKKSFNYISDCEIKIALLHHPIDWLIPSERQIVISHLTKEFDILLLGHVHENSTSYQTGFSGSLFINIAPAYLSDIRENSKAFSNGFTVIDYDNTNRTLECSYYKYDLSNKVFNLNEVVAEEGKYFQKIPDKTSAKERELIKKLIQNIKSEHYEIMNEQLITHKASQDNAEKKDLKGNFIFPPIDEGNYSDAEDKKNLGLNDIVKTHQNIIFFGNQEIGKTTLLYRLIYEYVENFVHLLKIPVYINVDEIGNKDITTCIKEYLRCNTLEVKQLLKDNNLVILFDNLNYSSNAPIDNANKIHRFNENFEHIQIIATASTNISGVAPVDYVNMVRIPFKKFFIRNFQTKHVKKLMKIWIPNEDSLDLKNRLEKLVNDFNSYSLAPTAISVSLFLWSTENHDRKPINNAVLLDIYIELILEKLNTNNIYRDTFDFRNKCLLISAIAQEMLLKDELNYCISYSEYIKVIEDYLKNKVGFDYDSNKIGEYFIEQRIFSKYQNNNIKFSKSCFFHFFLAKRMEYNNNFREYVLQEDNYYKFRKEIDYYAGLTRNDEELLGLVYERFVEKFKPTEFLLDDINVDNYFTLLGFKDHEPIGKKIEINEIRNNRPSEGKLEELYNQKLAQVKDPNKILKKNGNISLERLLIIMCNILRNSEGVENLQLKKNVYNSIVKYSLT